jgi:hypothetical protein
MTNTEGYTSVFSEIKFFFLSLERPTEVQQFPEFRAERQNVLLLSK